MFDGCYVIHMIMSLSFQFFKFTVLLRPHAVMLVDRYSERKEIEEKGRLLSQAEKEASKNKESSLSPSSS